jgi:hypothetical protein
MHSKLNVEKLVERRTRRKDSKKKGKNSPE